MSRALAYVDTSVVAAVGFGESGATAVARRLDEFDALVSANLLEAELRSAFARERRPLGAEVLTLLAQLEWVSPDRPLHEEITRTLAMGHVRGADCWHLATALYAADELGSISFLTLDIRQRDVAAALGFAI